MPAIAKIGPKLAYCGVVSGLILIGWAARHSVAQGPPQVSPVPAIPADASAKPEPAKVAAPQDSLDRKSETAPVLPDLGAGSAVPVPRLEGESNPAPYVKTNAEAPAPVTVAPDHSSAEVDDPEKVVKIFVEENQKHAEAQLKALKEEAEKLRARLTKVEAGIKRWDRLREALKQSQGTGAATPPGDRAPATPPDDRAPASPKGDVPTEKPALKDPGQPAGEADTLTPVDAASSPRTTMTAHSDSSEVWMDL